MIQATTDVHRARAAAHSQAFFEALGTGVTDSKTFQGVPAAGQAFVARATENGPIADSYIPTAPFIQYWQEKGVDPNEVATELTGDANALENAVKDGAHLRVPTANYAATLAPTEHNAFFSRELKLGDPHAMNGREAEAFDKQVEAALAEAKQQRATIEEDLTRKQQEAGTSRAVAHPVAEFFGSIIQNLTGRQALSTAEERYRSMNVDVTREGINDEAARQAAADNLPPSASASIPPSVGNDRETRTQAAARRQAHINALVSVVTRDAQAQDPTVDPDVIRAHLEQRLDAHLEARDAGAELASGGQDLLRAIARNQSRSAVCRSPRMARAQQRLFQAVELVGSRRMTWSKSDSAR